MIGGFLWWLPSSKNNSAASIAQKAEERADAEEQLQEHQNRFATTHGAVWIESLLVSPTNSTRFGEPLTADVQQILTPVLTGRVLLSRKRIDVALVMDDPHWLDLIRTNASVTLKVAAEIESVTPTRVLEVNEGNSGEVVVLRATGHAIGLDISQD
jgi:hypothetical protein